MSQPPRRRAPWLTGLLPLLLYAALAVAFFSRAWFASPGPGLVDGSGDPQQTVWFLRWMPWAISHGVNPFVTHHVNWPDGVNLMWNALAPLLGVLLWPITATAGAVVAYDVLVTAELALSAWCAYLLIRRYVAHRGAALLGGALYGFSPFLTAQSPSHAKVAFALLPPLVLLLIDDVAVQLRSARRGGLLLGVLLGLQLLVYEEGFVLAVVAGVVVLAVLAVYAGWDETRGRAGHVARAVAWAVPPLALIAVVPMYWQVFGPDRLPSLLPGGAVYVTDVANLVVPTSTQWLSYGQTLASRFSGNTVENASYLGIPLLLVMLYTLLRWWRRGVVVVAASSAIVLGILCLGPQLHVGGHVSRIPLPWKVISVLPLFGSALPSRLFVYVDLAAAVLLAVFAGEVVFAARPRVHLPLRAVAVGVVALVALTLLPLRAGQAQIAVPSFFTAPPANVRVPVGSVVLVAPFSHDGTTALPMVWQAAADIRFRMPEGYFVNVAADGSRRDGPPPSATAAAMEGIAAGGGVPDASGDAAIRADLTRWHVGAVVVGPMPGEDRMVAFFTRVLRATPAQAGGVSVWWGLPYTTIPMHS